MATMCGSPAERGRAARGNARLLETGYRFLYPSYREGYRAVLKAPRET